MSTCSTIQISCEAAEFIAAMEELTQRLPELAVAAPEFFLRLDDLLESGAMFAFDGNRAPAADAGEVVVRLDPSDGLRRLLTAIRAGDFDLQRLNDCFSHSASSVGEVGTSHGEAVPDESQGSSGARPSISQGRG